MVLRSRPRDVHPALREDDMERGPDGKFIKSEHWDDRERRETLERRRLGWERSLERLQSEVEKLRNRRVSHGRNKGDR
jgi:hypothetical protein